MIEITSLDQNEALRYMQYYAKPDENMQNLLDDGEREILRVISPKYTYKVFNLLWQDDIPSLENCNLELLGNDIKKHLKNCEKAVLMCATISSAVDRFIRMTEISNMAKALVVDCLASVAIEQVCDKAEAEICKLYPQYNHTSRFSAGYGDFPIDLQNQFLDILNAQKIIGLYASDCHILTPRKSVTAVFGLSKEKVNRISNQCEICSMRDTCSMTKCQKKG